MTSTAQHKLAVVAIVVAAFATAAPANASYGWPLRPFRAQHPVRGFFGDPRIAGSSHTIHFGIDISGPNGAAVYATVDGVASINPRHSDSVLVTAGRRRFEYWHVVPSIRPGQRVVAYRTVIGHIEKPWAHVHFSEAESGVYVNPLRPGALQPYVDRTAPTVHAVTFEHGGRPAGARVSGTLDLVAEAFDTTPLAVPAPWNDRPVAPALVEWRLVGGRATASAAWRVAVDFRGALPSAAYPSIYAAWTRQNRPSKRNGHGRYRYYLARGLDTRSLPNGSYRVVVRASDTAGNTTSFTRVFTVANGV